MLPEHSELYSVDGKLKILSLLCGPLHQRPRVLPLPDSGMNAGWLQIPRTCLALLKVLLFLPQEQ